MKLIDLDLIHLKSLTELWNREIGRDFPMKEELLKQNSFNDENVLAEGSKIATDQQGNILGFVVSKKVKEGSALVPGGSGWIQVLLVDSRWRDQGVGTALLDAAESALKNAGTETVHLGGDPWHYFPGIPKTYIGVKEWFRAKGYEEIDSVSDLLCDLTKIKSTNPEGEPSIKVLSPNEKEEFVAFLHLRFPGRWEYEAIEYFNKGGTGREYAIMKLHGNIIGFIRINDTNSSIIGPNVAWSALLDGKNGGIGPLAIAESERGNGYGLELVLGGLRILKERGASKAVIDWTEKIDFYRKTGAEIWKSYNPFKKVLE
ncbi:GNAT family N-acetyltransferase [Bacillus sp. REN3]|uniref:GNAT family N-acetyltransferase n=1 Tax=Bacillus sp. REN3 TaxID=2802440 RepID=UPI001AEE52A9|nr:GNAT family N-acetyltransferase [Bacillus sp. REN3]